MQKLGWLTLFFAVALLVGAQENAFAHPSHQHATQAQSVAAPLIDVVDVDHDTQDFVLAASASSWHAEKCPHEHGVGCDGCCACGGHASVAIPVFGGELRELPRAKRGGIAVSSHIAQQTALDLTRPPKSFA